jgi:hypothetical protein
MRAEFGEERCGAGDGWNEVKVDVVVVGMSVGVV